MNLLPIEILTKISYHLSFSDRKCFSLVCLRFHKSLHAKELWQNVTFVIGKSILENVRTNFLNILTNLKFFSVDIHPKELHNILQHTHNLTSLELIICRDLFANNDELNYFFRQSISTETKLNLNRLFSLNLSGNKSTLTDTGFICLVENCVALKRIDLSELDIETLTQSNEFNDDWRTYSKFVHRSCEKPDKLTFISIINQLIKMKLELKEINLSSTGIGFDELWSLVNVANVNLSVIQLDNCKNIDRKSIQMLLNTQNHCLEELSLINTIPIGGDLLIDCFDRLRKFKGIRVKSAGKLEVRSIDRISIGEFVTYFHVENCLIDNRTIGFINRLKSIKTLVLLGCNFNETKFDDLEIRLESLEELNLSRSYGFREGIGGIVQSIFRHDRLVVLKLDWVKINDKVIIEGLDCLRRLGTLSLIGCSRLTGDGISRGLEHLESIRQLSVHGVKQIDNQFLTNIAHFSSVIEEINLSGSSVTDEGLIEFLKGAYRLRKLRLDNCLEITENIKIVLPNICPYLQDLSMRNCDRIEDPIILNYYDSMFLYQWHLLYQDRLN